ncbi:MAG: hypothetical protein ACR2G6_04095 [Gemmatimonadaceae bacterium]
MSSRTQSSAPELPRGNAPSPLKPTVFSVLAAHARESSLAALGATVLVGTGGAITIASTEPALWWLAAGFVTLAAYGGWGLADRALGRGKVGWQRLPLRAVRAVAVVLGCTAAPAVLLGLMRWALGGWFH